MESARGSFNQHKNWDLRSTLRQNGGAQSNMLFKEGSPTATARRFDCRNLKPTARKLNGCVLQYFSAKSLLPVSLCAATMAPPVLLI